MDAANLRLNRAESEGIRLKSETDCRLRGMRGRLWLSVSDVPLSHEQLTSFRVFSSV